MKDAALVSHSLAPGAKPQGLVTRILLYVKRILS